MNIKKPSTALKVFRSLTLATLVSLVLEFILGMYNALYVQFPDTLVNGNGWPWAMQSSLVITLHVVLGSLLLLLTLVTLIFGLVARSRTGILWSLVGLVMVLAAYVGGSVFLANVAENNYSFLMALGFMGSLLAYGTAYYFTRPTGSFTLDK